MNTSHVCCYCRKVLSSTSYNVMVAWYIRVKTESVVRYTPSVPFVSFLHFQANNLRDGISFVVCPTDSSSCRENDCGNSLITSSVFNDRVCETTLLDLPPEWPVVKLSPAALSVWAVHPCRLYSAHSVRMSYGTAKSELPAFAVFPIRKYMFKAWYREKSRTVVSVRAMKA
jgi:hypothetical protein